MQFLCMSVGSQSFLELNLIFTLQAGAFHQTVAAKVEGAARARAHRERCFLESH